VEGVEELLWDDHNLDHFARHDARPAEANSVGLAYVVTARPMSERERRAFEKRMASDE
jgi:hypothetical protein